MNKVILTGRLTKDAEVRYSQNQTAVARFNLATPRMKQGEADFPQCVAFGKTAELIEKYVRKGNRIGIEGRLYTGSYEKDGKKYYSTNVIIERIEFLESKAKEEPKPEEEDFMSIADGLEDDGLPF